MAFVMTSTAVSGQQMSEEQIRQRIGENVKTMRSVQADFVQTKHLRILDDEMVSKGEMSYEQADKLRWEYKTPYTYTFILNKDKVYLKNERKSDVIDVNQNKVFKEIARIMMDSVVGNSLNDGKTFKTQIGEEGSEWVATLQPQKKDMKQLFQKIVLHFDKSQVCVSRVELYEKNGDKTTIELKNIKINEAVSPGKFSID